MQRPVAVQLPAREHGAAHAEALDHLGLLADGLGEAVRDHRRRRRLDGRALGHHLVGEGDGDEEQAAADREPAEQRVEAEDREDEDRRPRQVEEREEHRRGHELLHRLEVAQARPRPAALARDEGAGEAGLEDPGVEAGLDQRADAGGDAAAGVVEHAHDAVERRDQHGERDEGRLRPARQHPVVDLEHVERPGQHQDVDEAAEDRQRHEQRPRAAQGLLGGLGHGLQALTPLARGSREHLLTQDHPVEGVDLRQTPVRHRRNSNGTDSLPDLPSTFVNGRPSGSTSDEPPGPAKSPSGFVMADSLARQHSKRQKIC